MKLLATAIVAAFAASFCATPAVAQEQTAEGAHTFLAEVLPQTHVEMGAHMIETSTRIARRAPGTSTGRHEKASAITAYVGAECRGSLSGVNPSPRSGSRRLEDGSSYFREVVEYDFGTIISEDRFYPGPTEISINFARLTSVRQELNYLHSDGLKFLLPNEELATRVVYAIEFLRTACAPGRNTGF